MAAVSPEYRTIVISAYTTLPAKAKDLLAMRQSINLPLAAWVDLTRLTWFLSGYRRQGTAAKVGDASFFERRYALLKS